MKKTAPPATAAKKTATPAKAAAKPADKETAKPAGKETAKSVKETSKGSGTSHSETGTPAPTKTAAKPAAAPKKAKETPAPQATSPYDAKFLQAQRELLEEELAKKLRSAQRYEDEAETIISEMEPGDVQFDEESGEGDMMVVERERDLALSATVRAEIAEIEAALRRIDEGTYGLSLQSGLPIPKERLKAIPWASVRVEEKVGGIGSGR